MKIRHFMALVVLSLPTVPGARAAVLAGPLTNAANAHTYYLLSHNNWPASEAEARGLGGHLVTINDAAENQWVVNTFFPLIGFAEARIWIGLNDAANEGQFVWASGEPVTFTYWSPGQPDNLDFGGADYAAIWHSIFAPSDGRWDDISDPLANPIPTALAYGVVEVSLPPLPAAVTQPADQFMPGSARLNGLANPVGSPTLAWFEWGTSLAYGNATPPQSVGSGRNDVEFSHVLVGLVIGTEYHFRTVASNAFGLAAGVDQTFNLSNQLPLVTTLEADQLTYTNARLRGQVNPRGWPTAAWFEWGTDTNYGNLIGMQDVGQGSSVSNLNVVLNGLMVGPNYHYRLVASNAFGLAAGLDQTFILSTNPPVVIWHSPLNGATFLAGATISLQARVVAADNAVSFVEFFAASTNQMMSLGRVTSNFLSYYQLQWSNAPAGTFQLHAEAVDNLGWRGVSGSVQITINNPPPPPATWTGADPSGYWSAPANWSPAGVPVNGNDLVFPGGLPPGDMVSTNDLTDSFFRKITFSGASRHTIRGNPITLTNGTSLIINSGTNVIACDLIFSATPSPSTPYWAWPSIGFSGYPTELTVSGNVVGSSLYVAGGRLVMRGQFPGGRLRQYGGTLAFYGDYPHAVSATNEGGIFLVQGSQPNLNLTMLWEMESAACASLSGGGVVGDVTGCGHITPDSTLSVKNLGHFGGWGGLDIRLNGTNAGEYGRLVASGDVSLSSGRLLPSAGFNPQAGQIFTIVEKTSPGPIANAFLGPEGTITTLNGMPVRISYVGGDGNDVTLTVVTPVPIVLGAVQRFGTQFVFSYSANVGLRYAVERSETLSNWTTIRTDTVNVNPMTFTDTAATNRMNFYRVRRLPNP